LPYFHLALDLFGPQRLMFGSDWPVCLLAGDYQAVHHLFTTAIHALSSSEQAALAGGNALRIYGLEDYRP
jgi:L-fuconolactonase